MMHSKYFTAGVLCLFFLQSCKVLRNSFNQEVTALEDCQKISLENNRAIIYAQIEGKDQLMVLDLGAPSVIFDTTVIPDYYKKSKATFGTLKGADRNKVSSVMMPLKVRNKLHSSDNMVFTVLSRPLNRNSCSGLSSYIGLYGYDLMRMHETGYLLDFETKQVCNLKPTELTTAIAQGYQAVKAKVTYNHIIIYVSIDGVEYAFKFDTGYNGSFTMPYDNDKIGFLNDAHRSAEGMLARTVSGIVTGKLSSYNKKMTFGGKEYPSEIIVSEGVKSQLMGMGFIKAFNWIIDSKNKKVYIKKNNIAPDEQSKTAQNYFAVEEAGKLLVASRIIGNTGFEVGDEIIKVNDEEVTSSNCCTLLKLLNEKEDWKALKVMTRKQ
jgi:predicted aspartyl protease